MAKPKGSTTTTCKSLETHGLNHWYDTLIANYYSKYTFQSYCDVSIKNKRIKNKFTIEHLYNWNRKVLKNISLTEF